MDKFDARSNEDIFVGYSNHSKAYRIFNKKTATIEESLHVKFNESISKPAIINSNGGDIVDITPIDNIITFHTNTDISNKSESSTDLPKIFVEVRDHSHDLVIGDISQGV